MFKRRFNNRRGIAAIEFAIILPFLLAFLGGVIDFGVAFFVSHTVQNAAREGARYGVAQRGLSNNDSGVIARVNDRLPAMNLFQDFSISQTITACPDSEVSVTIQGTSPYFFLPIIPGFGDAVNITRTVKMRYEHC